MTFRDYLSEKNDSSRAIWSWMKDWRIPLSPKFMSEVFPENNNMYCFRAVPPDRISTLWRRSKSKKQVSTFTDFRDNTIFFGAGSFGWDNNLTTVSVLKGNVTIRGTVDLWTFPDGLGRRWIDVNSIMKYNTPFTEVLGKIRDEIKIQFPKVLNTLPLSTIGYHITPKGNVSWEMTDEFSGKDKNVIIKAYMDTVYKVIKAGNIVNIFRALSCETRLKIMQFLSEGEKSVGDIVKNFNLTQPTVSHHLKVLSDVGFVVKRKYRQWVLYAVNSKLWRYIEKIINRE